MSASFDPAAPLPSPPEPWVPSSMPSGRAAPPYHMTDMIAAEPAIARRLLERLAGPASDAATLAAAIGRTIDAGGSVLVTGCGTSEHAALGATEIWREALVATGRGGVAGRLVVEQAFEAALGSVQPDLLVAVSHEGGTAATNRALEAAREAGAQTALVTAGDGSPGATLADVVVATGEMDQSWCHTIGYLAPLVAATGVAAHLARHPIDPDEVAALLEQSSAAAMAVADEIAARVADAQHLVVIGSGSDRPAGRELVLKVEEAAWVPAAFRDLETFLHGHLPATGDATALVLLLTDRRGHDARVVRAGQALAAAGAVGVATAAILAERADATLDATRTPAGRIVVPDGTGLPAAVASLLGSLVPLQVLAERVARARGTNPDPIRRDDPRYREAAALTE